MRKGTDEYTPPRVSVTQLHREMAEREADYQQERRTCSCKLPIPGSVYLGRVSCVACGRFL